MSVTSARAVGLTLVALLLIPAFGMAEGVPQRAASALDLDADGLDDALAGALGPQDVLVTYARMPGASERAALAALGGVLARDYAHFPVLAATLDAAALPALAAMPAVRFVERDDRIARQLRESVPLLGVPEARETYAVSGASIVVAILDDGVYAEHPDLASRLVERHDATPPPAPLPIERPSLLDPIARVIEAPASTGHGTHVAGVVVGPGSQSGGAYEGVAPGARFVDVKVFQDEDDTRASIVMSGLDWVLTNAERLDIRVVSMSVGGRVSDGTDALSRAADEVVAAGIVVVTSAGNTGPSAGTVTSPGSAFDVITVGAVDKRKALAEFSSRGPTPDGRIKPDLVAPGVAIVSTVPPLSLTAAVGLVGSANGDSLFYGTLDGTSIAAPHVAGVVALMLEADPDLTPAQVKRILLGSAQDLGAPGADNETGFGFVNAIAAVQVAADPSFLDSPQFALDGSGEPLTAASAGAGAPSWILWIVVAVVAIVVGVGVVAFVVARRGLP